MDTRKCFLPISNNLIARGIDSTIIIVLDNFDEKLFEIHSNYDYPFYKEVTDYKHFTDNDSSLIEWRTRNKYVPLENQSKYVSLLHKAKYIDINENELIPDWRK